MQILDVMRMAAMLGKTPEVTIIGIEPKLIEESMELSPEMEASLPKLAEVVEAECAVHSVGCRVPHMASR